MQRIPAKIKTDGGMEVWQRLERTTQHHSDQGGVTRHADDQREIVGTGQVPPVLLTNKTTSRVKIIN